MTQQQAIDLLNEQHNRDDMSFNAGFRTPEVSCTYAAEWLIDEKGCPDELAYEYAFYWHEQLPEKYQVIA